MSSSTPGGSSGASNAPFFINLNNLTPGGTPSVLASPSSTELESITPRSLKDYQISPQKLEAVLSNHGTVDSPFFADWDHSPQAQAGLNTDTNDEPYASEVLPDRQYLFGSVSGPNTPFYASAAGHTETPASFVGSSASLSPLSATATMPDTPVLHNMQTPLFTPPLFQPADLSTDALESDLPYFADHTMQIPSHELLNGRGSLPLPGDPVDAVEGSIHNAQLPQATRSESNYSISSTMNDAGHDSIVVPGPTTREEGLLRRSVPAPPGKHASDPPLIPSLRRPEVLQIAKELQLPDRPVSPFSPVRLSSHETQIPTRQMRTSKGQEADTNLIDLDSDNETYSGQYAGQDQTTNFWEHPSDSENSSAEEEEELDGHPLYSTLSTSGSPFVRRAWENSKIVLMPPKYSLPQAFLSSQRQFDEATSEEQPQDWETYTALHALRQQAGSPDVFVGIGKTSDGRRLQAKLDQEKGELEIYMHEDAPAGTMMESVRALSLGQSLRRSDTIDTNASSTNMHALAPHLFISTSPTSSAESSVYPITPPTSPPLRPTIAIRSVSGALHNSQGESIAFPTMESSKNLAKMPLSPSRRLKIISETPVYRRRKVAVVAATSAPSHLPGVIDAGASAPAAEFATAHEIADRLTALSTASSNSLSVTAKTVKKKDSKVRLRVPKWLGGKKESATTAVLPNKTVESAPSTPLSTQPSRQFLVPEESQLVIEKVRIIRVDAYVVDWPGQQATMPPASQYRQSQYMHKRSSQALDGLVKQRQSVLASSSSQLPSRQSSNASRVSKRSSTALRYKHANSSSVSQLAPRDFSSDIAFLLDPPRHLAHLAGTFEQALRTVIRLTKDLSERLDFVQGYESYTVERLRTSVLNVVCTPFEDSQDLSAGQRERLVESLENVTMAFLHDRIYEQCIRPLFQEEDAWLASHITAYRSSNASLVDFGILTLGDVSFDSAIEALAELSGSDSSKQELWERMPPQVYKKLVQTISETTDSASTVIALLEAKTPLDCASLLRRVINELVKAAEQQRTDPSRSSLATDDLIPLLARTMVKAAAQNLVSMLYYVRTFRLSEGSQGDIDWAVVQFEAAIAFLRTDPLKLVTKTPSRSPSPAVTSPSLSPVQPTYMRSNSHDSLSLSMRSRRASLQSLPAESQRSQPKSPGASTSLSHHHKRTISSLPATRIVTYQQPGKRASVVSTVTTEEEVQDNPEMGPPAVPRREGRTSTDDGRTRPDTSLLATSHLRHRSTSSYSLASTELQIRPQILRPQSVRPPTRSFHISQDLDGEPSSQPTRIPLGRSQTTPYNATAAGSSSVKTSTELVRSGSDGTRRGSVDWWGPLRYSRGITPASPPPASEITTSPRSDSPASPDLRQMQRTTSERSSFDLDRSTADIGWLEWGRKRLSSITSAPSLAESAEGHKTVAELVAEKIANSNNSQSLTKSTRPRRNSESAASVLSSPPRNRETSSDLSEFGVLPVGDNNSATITARTLTYAGSRPKSTLSLSSMSSVETDSSASQAYQPSSPGLPRSATHASFRNSMSGLSSSNNLSRSRRFRKEIRAANLAPSLALPQLHLDVASVTSSLHSPGSPASAHSSSARPSPRGFDNNPYSSYMHPYSFSSSRFGTTPFSPIQEVPANVPTPSPDVPKSGSRPILPEITHAEDAGYTTSVPPTPKDATFPSTLPMSATSATITSLI